MKRDEDGAEDVYSLHRLVGAGEQVETQYAIMRIAGAV